MAKLEWEFYGNEIAMVKAGDTTLGVCITHGGPKTFAVVALSAKTKDWGNAHILDNHAHDLIGKFKTRESARKAGERYALAWQKKNKHLCRDRKCKCKPITTGRAKTASARA